MKATLHSEILAALTGTSSRCPMETATIIDKTRHQRGRVEAALLELYQAKQIYCCKIINGSECVVWWLLGAARQTQAYGRSLTPKKEETPKRRANRLSEVSIESIAAVRANPGLTQPALLALILSGSSDSREHITKNLHNLQCSDYLRREGEKSHYRYYLGAKA